MARSSPGSVPSALVCVASLGLAALCATGGCAAKPEPEVSNGLLSLGDGQPAAIGGPSPRAATITEPTGLEAAAARSAALDLLAWQDRKASGSVAPAGSVDGQGAPAIEAEPPEVPSTGLEPIVAGPTVDERVARAVEDLKSLLKERAGSAPDPFLASLELAALVPLSPSIAEDLAADTSLSPGERTTLEAFGVLLSGLSEPGVGPDPARAADAMDRAAAVLDQSLPVRIGAAELCSRVDGFGQYQTVEGNVFQAMRANRVIVYTEVERFSYRPTGDGPGMRALRPGDLWSVRLTQQLELYNESGEMSAWSRPAMPIVETSRAKRRDFHIVDQIDLPPNLTIGAYQLKITVKDIASGAQDTRTIPLRIVADPALARVGG